MKAYQPKDREILEPLEKSSIYGELLTFSTSREELEDHPRQLIFPENSNIAKHYLALNSQNKKIIERIVRELTDGAEFQGLNLRIFLYYLEKILNDKNEDAVLNIISRHIVAVDNYSLGVSSWTLTDKINQRKDTKIFYDSILINELLEDLEKDFFIDSELIKCGCGKVEIIKSEVLEEYNKATDFQKRNRRWKNINDNTKKEEYLITVSLREEFTQFAAECLGKASDEIIEKCYAVINYTYGYHFLWDEEHEREIALSKATEKERRIAQNVQKIIEKAKKNIEMAEKEIEIAKQKPERAKMDILHAEKKREKAKMSIVKAKESIEQAKMDIAQAKKALMDPPSKKELKAKSKRQLIDYVIEELYSQQVEHEKVQQERDEAYRKVEAAFFEQMLKNGGAKEIAPDEDPNA